MKGDETPTSQALHGLVRPVLWYLDLEFARAELEVDEFRDEALGLRFEDLYEQQGSGTFIQHLALGV